MSGSRSDCRNSRQCPLVESAIGIDEAQPVSRSCNVSTTTTPVVRTQAGEPIPARATQAANPDRSSSVQAEGYDWLIYGGRTQLVKGEDEAMAT